MTKLLIKCILGILIIFIQISVCGFADEKNQNVFPPKKEECINDYANLISSADREKIKMICKQLYKEELATLVICTMESIPVTKKEYKSAVVYGAELMNYWHIGRTSSIKDGILVLISIKDRKIAICTGYLTEHYLPDNEAHRIINKIMVPSFKINEYGKGIIKGLMEARKVMIKNKKLMYPERYKK